MHGENGYEEFIRSKMAAKESVGIDPGPCHESLFPFQVHIVEWALRLGKAAIFADCGLGKTRMQLEWARQVGGDVLIVAPLAVSRQTRAEGEIIGVPVTICRNQGDVQPGVNITNYEMVKHFDGGAFRGVVLDESSILKSIDGKTRRVLSEMFSSLQYRLCCTATPAPNDHVELGNHSEFLGFLRTTEMLGRFFVNDSFQTGEWRLKKHARESFWAWVHSWAVSVEKPSDLGDYDDRAFELPRMTIEEHAVSVAHEPSDTGTLFPMPNMSTTSMHTELRRTAAARAAKVAEIVKADARPWIIWCHTNYEADELGREIPEALHIRGSDSVTKKENALDAFSSGKVRVLVTKPSIAGFGVNWQHCPNAAFVGLSYSYEKFYQAVRRIWRFGQESDVTVHLVIGEHEGNIRQTIRRKESAHKKMRHEMAKAMRSLQRHEEAEIDMTMTTASGENWDMINGDCVVALRETESDTVGLSVFSPPFSDLFVYSDRKEDMGNCLSHKQFFEQFAFLVRELYRVTIPGRLAAVHCSDIPRNKWKEGVIGLYDFPGDIVRTFEAEGWTYHSRVCIWKSPVVEMQRTKANGLLYKQLMKDSSSSRVGMPDWVLVFRKWTDDAEEKSPVVHTKAEFDLDQWQEWASPVWMTVNQTKVLQYRGARGDKDERHVCPLQLDVIERCIRLWSNPGDLVLSPFAGIGSEGYVAIEQGREFLGIELKFDYFKIACRHLAAATGKKESDLFDLKSAGADADAVEKAPAEA